MIRTTTAARAAKALLKANQGRFFTVTFVKKNGEVRTINGHCGHKPGHDGHNNVSHLEKYLTIWTPQGLPKNINMETLLEVTMGGTTIKMR